MAQAEEANRYEQEPVSSNRAPFNIDMMHGNEQLVFGSLEPKAIESFLQDAFTRQNAQKSKKVKEHDLSLRHEFQEILKLNTEQLTTLQKLVSKQKLENTALKHEQDLIDS